MPSSSTHDTSLEKRIFWHFKVTYARACACRFDRQAAIITHWYAELLEIPSKVLQDQAYADANLWNNVFKNAKDNKESDNVAIIGNMTADVAKVLFQFGRNAEAAKMCENADSVYDWQQKLEREDRKWSR